MSIEKNKLNPDYTESESLIISFLVGEKLAIRSYSTVNKNIHVPKKYKKKLLIHHNNHIKAFNFWIKEYNKKFMLTNKKINKTISKNRRPAIDFSKFKSALIQTLEMEKTLLDQYLSCVGSAEVNQQAFIKNIIQPHQLLHINNIKQTLGKL